MIMSYYAQHAEHKIIFLLWLFLMLLGFYFLLHKQHCLVQAGVKSLYVCPTTEMMNNN